MKISKSGLSSSEVFAGICRGKAGPARSEDKAQMGCMTEPLSTSLEKAFQMGLGPGECQHGSYYPPFLSEGRPRHICKRAIEILMKKLEKCFILQHYSK